jgi:hypothetical protein
VNPRIALELELEALKRAVKDLQTQLIQWRVLITDIYDELGRGNDEAVSGEE